MEITNGIYSAEDVASKLLKSSRSGTGWLACCPAHDNTDTPALSINNGDNDKILVKCFAGCKQNDVINALKSMGAWPEYKPTQSEEKFKIIKEYLYTDEHSNIAYVVCRTNSKPRFIQKRPHEDGSWIWGLGEGMYVKNVMGDWSKPKKAVENSVFIDSLKTFYPYRITSGLVDKNRLKEGICLCEGEKDADNLGVLGFITTTFSGGAGAWKKEYLKYFEGRKVYIIKDNDDAGEEGAIKKAEILQDKALLVKIIKMPQNGNIKVKDVSNWLENGGTKEQFIKLVKETPEYQHREKEIIPADSVLGIAPNQSIDSNVGFIEWAHTGDKGKPLSTIQNTAILLRAYNISIRYNVVKKDIEVSIPGRQWLIDNHANCALAEISSLAVRHGLAEGRVKQYLIAIADAFAYNPFADWIKIKEWDGISRIEELFNTLDCQENEEFGLLMLKKWLIAGIEANFNHNGVSRAPVLVLQGSQYLGKTTWFWSLINGSKEFGKESCSLNPSDKDSVMQAVSYAICELGELESIFKRAEMGALKAFLSKDFDQLRKPYAETDSKYPRRTIFMATVNQREVLHDETGNTRFWMIECGTGLNGKHGINMQQVWAEAFNLWQSGTPYLMTRDEIKVLNTHNLGYTTISVVEELIIKRFDFDARKELWIERTSTDIMMICGIQRPSAKDRSSCAAALSKLCGEPIYKHGSRVYKTPPLMNPTQDRFTHWDDVES